MNSALSALLEVAFAICSAMTGAFMFFRTDDFFRFEDRWGLLTVDANSEFWRTNTRIVGGFFIAFSLLLFLLFLVESVVRLIPVGP
jgi:hypothetical protein